MDIQRLNYLLTGEESPQFCTEREKTLIQNCLRIINDIESGQQFPSNATEPHFTKSEVITQITNSWVREFKNLNNDPNTGKVNGAGYFVIGFVSSALEEAISGMKNYKAPHSF